MPELPEVETVRRTLAPLIEGKEIVAVEVLDDKIVGNTTREGLEQEVVGRTIGPLRRRGKYLIVPALPGKELVFHLRMTGKLLVFDAAEAAVSDDWPTRFLRLYFTLADPAREDGKAAREVGREAGRRAAREAARQAGDEGEGRLYLAFDNLRRFGRCYLTDAGDYGFSPGYGRLGPEPLSEDFTLEHFEGFLKGRKANIKALLLGQAVVAGLGNIYVDEALNRARVHPMTPGGELSQGQIEALWAAIREVIADAIDARGTSFSDYVDARGKAGGYQARLRVYQREGEECLECREAGVEPVPVIERARVAGRSSHYCPRCQKKNEKSKKLDESRKSNKSKKTNKSKKSKKSEMEKGW